MGRIIYNQTIATTHVDRSGDRIEPEQLRRLYAQMPDPWVGAAHHNLSLRPPAALHRPRVVDLADGELAIVAAIEVLDEGAFATAGGFSIAYFRRVFRIGDRPEDLPADVRVTANPLQFDVSGMVEDLVPIVDAELTVDVVERVEKQWGAAETIAIIALAFQLSESKVVRHLVSRVFRGVRDARRLDSESAATHVHVHIHLPDRPDAALLHVDSAAGDDVLEAVDGEQLRRDVERELQVAGAIRVVGSISSDGATTFDFIVQQDGTTRAPTSGSAT